MQKFQLKLKNDLFKKRQVLTHLLFVLLLLSVECTKPSVAPQTPATTPTPSNGVPVPYSLERQRTYGAGTSPSAFVQTKDGGSVVVGTGYNTSYAIFVLRLDQAGNQIWSKTFKISIYESAADVIATLDNSFVISASGGSQGSDAVLLKIDQNGELVKTKIIGGSGNEYGGSLTQTSDGSIWMASSTNSSDGDLTGVHAWGKTDAWLIKLTKDLDLVSQKRFGGSGDDAFTSITASADGNLLLASHTQSTDGQVTGSHVIPGGPGQIIGDYWISKVDLNGALLWQKDYGGSLDDWPFSIFECSNGNIVCSGQTVSSDGDITGYHNVDDHGVSNTTGDAWTICLNADGKLLWQKCSGGSGNENIFSISENVGNILLAGLSDSNDGDVLGNHGRTDTWLLELGTNGELLWQGSFGGSRDDNGIKIITLPDGSLSILSRTDSNDMDVAGSLPNGSIWMMKLSH